MRITFKGSITIFMALLLTSIMALSGAVLEILRYSGMKNVIIEADIKICLVMRWSIFKDLYIDTFFIYDKLI